MKKLIFIFTVLVFISCESEDSADDSNNSSNSDSSVLVKTITTTTNDGDYSNVITEEYFYEGNKIERKLQYSSDYNNSDDVYYTTYYTYANNKISNVKIYDYDNDLVEEIVFDYDSNGNLSSYTDEYFEYSEISYSFTYDGNYIMICETESYYDNISYDYAKYTTNSNGDITFAETVQSCGFSAQRSTGEDASTANVEYDSNPSPFKNIEGNNFLITTDADIFTYADLYGYYNNVTKVEWSYFDESYSTELKFDYNSDNYPRNVQIFGDGELYESVNIEYY